MAATSMTQGLKLALDKLSAVSGAGAALQGMSFDDNTHTFLNSDTACATQGASPHFQGNAFDSTPTGGAAATPYVTTHLCTLTSGQFNTFTIKRYGLHNTTTPSDAGTTLMWGIDGFAITKQSTFSSLTTMQLSLS